MLGALQIATAINSIGLSGPNLEALGTTVGTW